MKGKGRKISQTACWNAMPGSTQRMCSVCRNDNSSKGLLDRIGGMEIFALFFHNFSTWLGRAGIYLEDLFVLPEYRGKGYGKLLLKRLARLTLQRGCGRLEWACLDWNTPSRKFYDSLGAVRMEEWTTYRLTGDALLSLASNISLK